MVLRRTNAHRATPTRPSKPFPQMRPDLEIQGFTLSPRDLEDEIFIVPELVAELLPEDWVTTDGMTVLSPERTLLDLANVTKGADLWRMLDNALTKGLTSASRLEQAILRHPRHNGSNRLAKFLATWTEIS